MWIFFLFATAIIVIMYMVTKKRSSHSHIHISQQDDPDYYRVPNDYEIPRSQTSTYQIQSSISMVCKRATYDEPLTIPDITGRFRFHSYNVKGKNPKTNRFKSVSVTVPDFTSQEEIISISGLVAPVTVTFTPSFYFDINSPNWQDELSKFNIPFSDTYARIDVSCLIDKQRGNDSKDLASDSLRLFLAEFEIYTSPYCGNHAAIWNLWEIFSKEDKLYFWCYLVYCSLKSLEIENPNTSPYKDVFRAFSAECFKDAPNISKIILSFLYSDIETCIFFKNFDRRRRHTKAYEFTKSYLISKGTVLE